MRPEAGVLALVLALAAGCTTSDRFGPDDAGAAGRDGAAADPGARGLGSACAGDSECPADMFCDEEIPIAAKVAGAEAGEIDVSLFPGGSCSPLPLSPYDPDGGTSCDPLLPAGAQGCGSQGTCVPETLGDETLLACRVRCAPSASASGCDRDGYTCDFALHACIEGCRSDDECRLSPVDSDGDGHADELRYDAQSRARCSAATSRCTHPAKAGAVTGSPCERADDCAADGTCIRELSSVGGLGFPGGSCTKVGCEVDGRQCEGEDAVCEPLRPWSGSWNPLSVCLHSCQVGAEPEADRLGAAGKGLGCRQGYRCHYNGGTGPRDGVCVGGVYNDVVQNNVGAACETDAQCYSPFGHGRCLTLQVGDVVGVTGTCTIMDCAVRGLPADLCGAGRECILLRDDLTFCAQTCTVAAQCAAGFACSDDDADKATTSICYPACFDDAECRAGAERCDVAAGATDGRCVASAPQGR